MIELLQLILQKKFNFLVEQITALIGLSIDKINTLKDNINFYE